MRIFVFLVMAIFLGLDLYAQDGVLKKDPKRKEIKTFMNFTPDMLLLDLESGKTHEQTFMIKNLAGKKFTAEFVIYKAYKNDLGHFLFTEKKGFEQQKFLGSNIVIQKKTFEVKEDGYTPVSILINIPKENDGSYYFFYSIRPTMPETSRLVKESKDKLSSGLNVRMQMVAVAAINVKDKKIFNVKGNTKVKYKNNDLHFRTEIENKGNHYLYKYEGKAVLIDSQNNVVTSVDLVPQIKNRIFPSNSKRIFMGLQKIALKKGNYEIVTTFVDESKNNLFVVKDKMAIE